MSNTPAPASSNALAALGNLKAGLTNVVTSAPITGGGDPILRLQIDGKWCFGQDNVEPDPEDIWAINPLTVRHGIVCWKVRPQNSREKPELYGKFIVPMTQAKPEKTKQAYDSNQNAIDHDQHPWVDMIGVDMVNVTGESSEDDGEQVIYEPTSNGGIDCLKGYIKDLMKQIDKGEGKVVALVKLRSDSYPNKRTGGKTYYPIFDIVDWVTMDENTVPASAAEEPQPEPEQPKETQGNRRGAANGNTTSAAPEPASVATEAPQAESGERRRRRRA